MMSDDIKYIDTISDEISLYIESTQRIINGIKHLNSMRDTHYLEATSNDEKPSILKRMKENISKIIAKLKMMVTQLFKKNSSVLNRYQKVETIGKALNNTCLQGISLGDVKITIPNVLEYDKRLTLLLSSVMNELSMKAYKEYGKNVKNQNKIDALTEGINDIASKLNSYSVTANNIKSELRKVNKAQRNVNMNQLSSLQSKKIVHNNRNLINRDTIHQSFRMLDTANRDMRNATDIAIRNHQIDTMMMSSVEDNNLDDDVFIEGLESELWSTTPLPMKVMFIVNFTAITLTAGLTAYSILKTLPSSIKNEKITVSDLYKRIQSINPDKSEKELNKLITRIDNIGKRKDFANADDAVFQYMNSIQRLITAYTKFKYAELDYYCRILIETYSKLAIEDNLKKKK